MALASAGLATWQWNNNLKSILILLSYPLMLLALLWGGAYTVFSLSENNAQSAQYHRIAQPLSNGYDAIGMANMMVLEYWPIILGISTAWVLIGYFFHSFIISKMTGSHKVSRQEEPQLYNLLENLCISRGMKVPKLHVIENDALNAFASGINDNSYAVTVTRGLMNKLDDRELQAVLAHELSHIRHRDVRLLIITIVFSGMISILADIAWRSILNRTFYGGGFGHSDRRRSGGNNMLMMIIIAAFLFIGNVIALLLRFALSRRREFMADAGAVELTHDADAMISALRKISGHADMPNVPPDVRQMFIENPPNSANIFGFMGLFATHPPIEARIEALQQLGGIDSSPQGRSHIPSAG